MAFLVGPTDPILADPKTVVLDATWLYLPDPPTRDAHKEFLERRLPGARFWSLDEASEPHPKGFVLMLPSPERFAKLASAHGITPSTHVVIYDTFPGLFSAPRTAFTFFAYGHQKVSLLDGGLPRAVAEGIKLETGEPQSFKATEYPVPALNKDLLFEYADVLTAEKLPSLGSPNGRIILDARSPDDFEGKDSDKAGHIPNSYSLPFSTIVDTQSEKTLGYSPLLTGDKLKSRLNQIIGKSQTADLFAGRRPVTTTCGGGLSAAIIWTALKASGITAQLYDESWNGYSQQSQSTIVKGKHISALRQTVDILGQSYSVYNPALEVLLAPEFHHTFKPQSAADLVGGQLVQDRETFLSYLKGLPNLLTDLKITPIEAKESGNLIVVNAKGSGFAVGSKKPYTNEYLNVFEFNEDGLLVSYDEFFDSRLFEAFVTA